MQPTKRKFKRNKTESSLRKSWTSIAQEETAVPDFMVDRVELLETDRVTFLPSSCLILTPVATSCEKTTTVFTHSMQARVEAGDDICISVITYSELRHGAAHSQARKKYDRLIDTLSDRLEFIADWSIKEDDLFATLQAALIGRRMPIGTNDVMIAGRALSLNAVLVTNNRRHFSRVDGLALENWLDSQAIYVDGLPDPATDGTRRRWEIRRSGGSPAFKGTAAAESRSKQKDENERFHYWDTWIRFRELDRGDRAHSQMRQPGELLLQQDLPKPGC